MCGKLLIELKSTNKRELNGISIPGSLLKFVFSKKATKIDKIFAVDLTFT